MKKLILSGLRHTWLFDLDGTIVKHNGYKIDGEDTLLDGVKDFFNKIPETDYIIILTARKSEYMKTTVNFLSKNKIRYNKIIFDLPYGERILINDNKPSGLKTGISINKARDSALNVLINIDDKR